MAWYDSTLTGLTGLVSLVTFGATPVYGEPEGATSEDRRAAVGGAVPEYLDGVYRDPLKPFKRGAEVTLHATTGVDLPWWAWAAIAAGGMYAWRRVTR